jgi:hypothetical protein
MSKQRRQCPPGVFCIENVTIMFIGVIFLIIGLFVYYISNSNSISNRNSISNSNSNSNSGYKADNIIINTGTPKMPKGRGEDVFFDIYQPPLRDDRYLTGGALDIRGNVRIPINVSTQGTDDSEYRQLGILTRVKDELILPLMGRPLFTRRDKWNFYTLNDKNNMIKLPVKVNGKSGTSEYGCDNVFNGDHVYVEGYNDAFKVTAYDNNVVRYLPSSL